MQQKQLRKLNRRELLEILLEMREALDRSQEENQRLQAEITFLRQADTGEETLRTLLAETKTVTERYLGLLEQIKKGQNENEMPEAQAD